MEKTLRLLVEGNKIDYANLVIEEHGPTIRLKLKYKNFLIEKEGEHPFEVLIDLRKELENMNYFILCNGSRLDVYPSRMTLIGFNAYQLRMGEKTTLDDLVNIFDDTDKINLITTIKKQKQFYRDWLES